MVLIFTQRICTQWHCADVLGGSRIRTDWTLQFSENQCRKSGSYTKNVVQHSPRGRLDKFYSLAEAQAKCSQNEDCGGVFDEHCDSQGVFWTMYRKGMEDPGNSNSAGGCLWETAGCLKWEAGPPQTVITKDFAEAGDEHGWQYRLRESFYRESELGFRVISIQYI